MCGTLGHFVEDLPRLELSFRRTNERSSGIAKLRFGLVFVRNRGDWTPLELFLTGMRGWDEGTTQRFFTA